ncbi:hypothetical protein O9993_23145 [Vibrio lentus]|nr:hypothetical protein [Vibrio lentus]
MMTLGTIFDLGAKKLCGNTQVMYSTKFQATASRDIGIGMINYWRFGDYWVLAVALVLAKAELCR